MASQALLAVLLALAPIPASADSETDVALRRILESSRERLGKLEPWQKKIYDAEVLSEPARWVADYREGAGGVQGEADLGALSSYLRFWAPVSLKREKNPLWILAKPGADCPECAAAAKPIRAELAARMERRGFKPLFPGASELAGALAKPSFADSGGLTEETEIALAKRIEERDLSGALVVSWALAPVDPSDAAHADERHFLVRSHLLLREGTGTLDRERLLTAKGSLESQDEAGIQPSIFRLLTDAWLSLGGPSAKSSADAGGSGEILFAVDGIKEFATLLELQAALEGAFKGSTPIRLRRLGKGKVEFAIGGGEAEARARVATIRQVGNRKLEVAQPSANGESQIRGTIR